MSLWQSPWYQFITLNLAMLVPEERPVGGSHHQDLSLTAVSPVEEAGPSSAVDQKTLLHLKSEDMNSSPGSAPNTL